MVFARVSRNGYREKGQVKFDWDCEKVVARRKRKGAGQTEDQPLAGPLMPVGTSLVAYGMWPVKLNNRGTEVWPGVVALGVREEAETGDRPLRARYGLEERVLLSICGKGSFLLVCRFSKSPYGGGPINEDSSRSASWLAGFVAPPSLVSEALVLEIFQSSGIFKWNLNWLWSSHCVPQAGKIGSACAEEAEGQLNQECHTRGRPRAIRCSP